jgi:hypothetical protein
MSDDAFEREKACFEHNTTQMRALNEQMSKVPTMSITLTGGLWFAASQAPALDLSIKFWLLIFAGIANLGLALSCFRIRDVMQSYLEKIEEFAPQYFVTGRPKQPRLEKFTNYSMITIYAALMISAAGMSLVGAFLFYWPLHADYKILWMVVTLLIVAAAGVYFLRRKPDEAN